MDLTAVLSIFSLVANFLMGMIMFFMKYASDDLRDKLKSHQEAIDKIKDEYIKKEDFREFKEELFVRLDTMKIDLNKEIERLIK